MSKQQNTIVVCVENYNSFLDIYPVHILLKLSTLFDVIVLIKEEDRSELILKIRDSFLPQCKLKILCLDKVEELNELLQILQIIKKCALIVSCTHGHKQRFIINLLNNLKCEAIKIGYSLTRPSFMEYQHYDQRSTLRPKGINRRMYYDFNQWYNILLQSPDEFNNDFELSKLDRIYCPTIEWTNHYTRYFDSTIYYDQDVLSYPKFKKSIVNYDKTLLIALDIGCSGKGYNYLINDIVWVIKEHNITILRVRPHPGNTKQIINIIKELKRLISKSIKHEINILLSMPNKITLESDMNQCKFILSGLSTILYSAYRFYEKIFYVSKGYAEECMKTRKIYRTFPKVEEMVPANVRKDSKIRHYIVYENKAHPARKSEYLESKALIGSQYDYIVNFLSR
ncbi:hypothetical protein Q3Y53_00965 [Synechococcus sp. YX-04-1]|uniref:hypothetical protein n=1 Tax=Synechococcus sp. YX-04-1 TaxID=3062778 RepID=UPI0026E375C5|nr:hypothetical protein [Synechococcus sp. YX-04-1]MDO6351099.1 hypothetical protein [Synechococcus sp. YX-04-1]